MTIALQMPLLGNFLTKNVQYFLIGPCYSNLELETWRTSVKLKYEHQTPRTSYENILINENTKQRLLTTDIPINSTKPTSQGMFVTFVSRQ